VCEINITGPAATSATQSELAVAIVADDLTGALDAAAPFAALGLKTHVRLDIDWASTSAGSNSQVLSLTSESRHLSAQAADERVWNVTRAALAHAPRILMKKIDSTLRGNVAVEILAGLRASGMRHALIAPAVPSHGRTMRSGEVFIHGMPLRQTQIGADALSPPPSAALPEVLRALSRDMNVHLWTRNAPFALSAEPGIHAYIADCETDADMDAIGQFALNHCTEMLPVGASGLATAMARRLVQAVKPGNLSENKTWAQRYQKPVLFVVGSRTEASGEQMAQLRAAGAEELVTPLAESAREEEPLTNFYMDQRPQPPALIVRPPLSREGDKNAASEVARLLGRTTASLLRKFEFGAVVMVGGDTAFETFKALGIHQAVVAGEIMPGIAIGELTAGGCPVTFVTKAGGFGEDSTLVEILRRFRNTDT
jgi:uncharacterized protein YgbK (DUF1537 family)